MAFHATLGLINNTLLAERGSTSLMSWLALNKSEKRFGSIDTMTIGFSTKILDKSKETNEQRKKHLLEMFFSAERQSYWSRSCIIVMLLLVYCKSMVKSQQSLHCRTDTLIKGIRYQNEMVISLRDIYWWIYQFYCQ